MTALVDSLYGKAVTEIKTSSVTCFGPRFSLRSFEGLEFASFNLVDKLEVMLKLMNLFPRHPVIHLPISTDNDSNLYSHM